LIPWEAKADRKINLSPFPHTRTSTALEQAGIPRSQWFGRNQTGVEAYPGKTFNDLAADQLKNNKLPPTGAEQLKSVRP